MRRSGAPSRKFVTPFKKPRVVGPDSAPKGAPSTAKAATPPTPAPAAPTKVLLAKRPVLTKVKPGLKRTPGRPSVRTVGKPALKTPAAATTAAATAAEPPAGANYYTVLFTKYSKKKHKTYDDGVLVLDGKHAVLKDMDGKQLSRSLTKFRSLEIDGSLGIGGYDLEVQAVLDASEYTSGRVFLGTAPAGKASGAPSGVKAGMKAFKPSSSKPNSLMKRAPPKPVVALHSADAPGAVVLQQPAAGKPGVPVVVDPHVSRCLRPHQVEGIQFMWDCVMGRKDFNGCGCILADSMGLGKTLSAITLAYTMCRQSVGGKPAASKVVIVTPAVVVDNWRQEFRKWVGDTRCKVAAVTVGGKEAEKIIETFGETVNTVCPMLIVSYEMFRKYAARFKRMPIGLLICDEGHRLKNSGGNQTIAALSSCPTNRRVILSGTPVQNDLTEFFSMVNFVNPNVLGTLKTFRTVFQGPIERGRDKSATPAEQELGLARSKELARLTQQFVLRRTSTVLMKYLPPKTESVVFCGLAPLQRTLYQQLLDTNLCRSLLTSTGADGTMVLVLIGLLKKLCAHPDHVYISDDDKKTSASTQAELEALKAFFPPAFVARVLHPKTAALTPPHVAAVCAWSTKLAVLDGLLQEVARTGDRVVLVSNYTQVLDMLQGLLNARGLTSLRLDGSVETGKRQPLVDRFNDPDHGVFAFLLSSKAGGVGLNLIGANRLVLFDPDWNPAIDQQAMARVWRDGQKRHVYVYRMITTGTIEEKMYQRQILKEDVAGAVVDDGGSAKRSLARDDLKELFNLGAADEDACETFRLMTAKQATAVKVVLGVKKASRKRSRRVLESDSEEEGGDGPAAAGAGAGAEEDALDLSMEEVEEAPCPSVSGTWVPFAGPGALADAALKAALQALPATHRVTYVHTTAINTKP